MKPNKKLNKPLEKRADRFEWFLLIACSTAYTLKALL